jgi:hypothetical protein
MDSQSALKLRPFHQLRIHVVTDVLKLSRNEHERFAFLQTPPPPSENFAQGDICRVDKPGHVLHGKIVQVHFASGSRVEVRSRAEYYNLTTKDLSWICRSQVYAVN